MLFEGFLVEVSQKLSLVLENNEDAVFNVLVTNYVLGQEWNFIIKTDNVPFKCIRVESCDESVNKIKNIDKCNIKFDKSNSSDEADQDNMLSNLLKKSNFQKNKKGKESTSSFLYNALRSSKSSINFINSEQ
ncbi:19564_t:CDS:2 [Cetraspora pellucida]|uniref:19564_t:CDS:1 n=1 Tax=Cetraspora pellucida TaxID=1433469 RepID=A0A9N9GT16_9GLOM|nr:19564_t:CDS:2 [Cetraspora pellucida]